jgi:hypothetical protein
MKGTADVQAGICGHRTTVEAQSGDARSVTFALETTCDNIERFKTQVAAVGPVDAYKEINPKASSDVIACGREAHICTDCIVPTAALKALRIATGLALPGDAAIAIGKE